MKFLNNNREAILDQCDKWTPGEDMSLKFSKLKESDEGLYSCEIWNGWERVYIRIISLKTEGKIHLYIYSFFISWQKIHISPLSSVRASFRMQR